ncbi:MAG: hypothetical protein ACREPD_13840 [Stenotrophomonas sp.]|uniref:hypothetical protein n=1 Tax=Stenotrophomonas sp. TaxID=69392 RepID=UPI003D6C72EA
MERRLPSTSTFLLLAFLCCLPSSINASGSLFRFEASQGAFHFSLEMTGRQDVGYIQIMSSEFKSYLPHRTYYVEFNRAQKRAYIRPRKRDGLPWFEVDVVGKKGVLHYEGRRVQGTANWTPEEWDN